MNEHVIYWYSIVEDIYIHAASDLDCHVAHIADWYAERWWRLIDSSTIPELSQYA